MVKSEMVLRPEYGGQSYGKELEYDLNHSGRLLESLQQECNKIRFTFLFLNIYLPEV